MSAAPEMATPTVTPVHQSQVQKLHERCGTVHHRFKACPDGFREYAGSAKRGPKKKTLDRIAANEAASSVAVASSAPPEAAPPAVAPAERPRLITDPAEIAALTPDALKQQLLLRAEMDSADKEWREAEASASEAAGTTIHLNRPQILRRTNEKAAKVLLNQLDAVLGDAGVTARAAANPHLLNKLVPASEVEHTRRTLAAIPEMREQAEQEAEAAEESKQYVYGEEWWVCENTEAACYLSRFRGPSIDYIRRKAKAERGFTWADPRCGGVHVRMMTKEEAA